MRWTEFTKTLENLLNENKQLTKSKTKKDSYKKKKLKNKFANYSRGSHLFVKEGRRQKIRKHPRNTSGSKT